MEKQLSEFMGLPHGDLKPVDRFDGKTFYTSPQLIKQYLNAIRKSGKGAPVFNKIEDLTSKSIITPVYKSKSILRAMFKLQPVQFRGIAGAALPQKKIVYIFVEQSANLFSFVQNNALASVTLHELIHLLSFTKPKVFFNLFQEKLLHFYQFYFCRLLNCNLSNIDQSKMKDFLNFLYFKIEGRKGFMIDNKLLKEYYDKIFEIFKPTSTLSDDQFTKMVTSYIVFIKLVQKLEGGGLGHMMINLAMKFKYLVSPLYVAYKEIFTIDALKDNQFAYQELFAPSEVISLLTLASSPDQKVYQAINKL